MKKKADGGGVIDELIKKGGLGVLPAIFGAKKGGAMKKKAAGGSVKPPKMTAGAGGGLGRLQKIGKGKKTSRGK